MLVTFHGKDEIPMKPVRMLLVAMFLAAVALPAFAGSYATLTAVELKAMIDRNESGLVIIDSRPRSQFEEAHIKGAISLPLTEMEQNAELPTVHKDARLVFYCNGNT